MKFDCALGPHPLPPHPMGNSGSNRGPAVPLLRGAASAPWRPSDARTGNALHSVISWTGACPSHRVPGPQVYIVDRAWSVTPRGDGHSRPGKIPQWFNLHGTVGHGYQGLVATTHAQFLLSLLCTDFSGGVLERLQRSWEGAGSRPWLYPEESLRHTWQL